jgi:hypothetical protein
VPLVPLANTSPENLALIQRQRRSARVVQDQHTLNRLPEKQARTFELTADLAEAIDCDVLRPVFYSLLPQTRHLKYLVFPQYLLAQTFLSFIEALLRMTISQPKLPLKDIVMKGE